MNRDEPPAEAEPEDRDLIEAARRGDDRAFDRLVARHGRLVLSVARSVTSHEQDAEDVAQDAFIRFFRSLDRFQADRPVVPWLVRITLNAARSQVTRAPERRERGLSENTLSERAESAGPDVPMGAREVRTALEQAAAVLSAREREVFILRDLHGMDAGTVAEVLGVTAVTVRRQSAEARRKIGTWLKRHRPELLR
jgi:RNA polymerase sigma-70 factor (ECF subfamily)